MARRLNKEKALLLVGAVLLAWTLFNLALFLNRPARTLGTPRVVATTIHPGDPDLRDALVIPPLRLVRGNPFYDKTIVLPPPPPASAKKDGGLAKGGEEKPIPAGPEGDGKKGPGGGKTTLGNGTAGKTGGTVVTPTEAKRIPKLGDIARLPLRLAGIVQIDGPEPARFAILRHKQTGDYYRVRLGGTVLDELRLDVLTDDTATLVDRDGRQYTFHGRLENQYN